MNLHIFICFSYMSSKRHIEKGENILTIHKKIDIIYLYTIGIIKLYTKNINMEEFER